VFLCAHVGVGGDDICGYGGVGGHFIVLACLCVCMFGRIFM